MPEYTLMAAAGLAVVVALELLWLHTGLFRSKPYWITMAICLFFMVLVNGWLTKLSAPIVIYDDDQRALGRFPLDIPLEDYLFGFTLLTLVLLLWVRQDRADDDLSLPWFTSLRRRRASRLSRGVAGSRSAPG